MTREWFLLRRTHRQTVTGTGHTKKTVYTPIDGESSLQLWSDKICPACTVTVSEGQNRAQLGNPGTDHKQCVRHCVRWVRMLPCNLCNQVASMLHGMRAYMTHPLRGRVNVAIAAHCDIRASDSRV